MRILILSAFLASITFSANSQTLFTYGKYSVDAKEFIRAFNKNNTATAANRGKAMREYLDLYINSRLKIREAYDRHFDTVSQVMTEVTNLRNQIAQNYMNDPSVSARLQKEAFQRSQKDIHIAHIFISFQNEKHVTDTAAAARKRDEVMEKLRKGEDFAKIAKTYSDDTSARTNGGDLGWITVFSLPYPLENLAYTLADGKYSQPIRSKSGYHIIKKSGERKAVGKMKAQQILIAIAPGASEEDKRKAGALADSIYKLIQKGTKFETLATTYSNDYISAATGGNIPDIKIGEYDPVFEKMAWSLTKDSAVTKPFLTSYGWHIVKRLAIKPVVTDTANAANKQEILSQVMADSRWKASKDFIFNKLKAKGRLTLYPVSDTELFLFTDSVFGINRNSVPGRITNMTPLVKLGETEYNVNEWIRFVTNKKAVQYGATLQNEDMKAEWLQTLASDYYMAHLEDFNDEFRMQMTEFRDGNLFFEIMQQEIWNKAQNDSTALLALFEKNKNKYRWEKAADAVIFFCGDESVAKELQAAVKKNPSNWKSLLEQYAEKVIADSSRYEWFQLPLAQGVTPVAGMVTPPLVNTNDNSASFAYIFKVYTSPMPRNFSEAKGLVINDYQEELEKQWIERLKKKYPVTVNEKVLNEISK